jgi:DNA-binding NtrC family response regulator
VTQTRKQEFEHLGSTMTIQAKVRMIAATHGDLGAREKKEGITI